MIIYDFIILQVYLKDIIHQKLKKKCMYSMQIYVKKLISSYYQK